MYLERHLHLPAQRADGDAVGCVHHLAVEDQVAGVGRHQVQQQPGQGGLPQPDSQQWSEPDA